MLYLINIEGTFNKFFEISIGPIIGFWVTLTFVCRQNAADFRVGLNGT
jgi:hypothetical protein